MKPNQLHPTTHVQAQCRPYLFLLFALLCVLPLWADQPEDIKKKEITKSFKADKNDQLQVDNCYGNIHVTYWKKNEVEFRIVIEAKTKSEEKAQEWIDRVKIQMDKTGNTISAVTSLRRLIISSKCRNGLPASWYKSTGTFTCRTRTRESVRCAPNMETLKAAISPLPFISNPSMET